MLAIPFFLAAPTTTTPPLSGIGALNPSFWYEMSDSSTITVTSGRAVEVRDKGAFGRHIYQFDATAPIYDGATGSIQTQGSQRLKLTSQLTFNGDFTLVSVISNLGDLISMFDNVTSGTSVSFSTWTWAKNYAWGLPGTSGAAGTRFSSSTLRIISDILIDNTPTLTSIIRSGSSLSLRIGTASAQTTAYTFANIIDFPVGQTQINVPVNIRYYDLVGFDRALSPTELQSVQAYLSSKQTPPIPY